MNVDEMIETIRTQPDDWLGCSKFSTRGRCDDCEVRRFLYSKRIGYDVCHDKASCTTKMERKQHLIYTLSNFSIKEKLRKLLSQ